MYSFNIVLLLVLGYCEFGLISPSNQDLISLKVKYHSLKKGFYSPDRLFPQLAEELVQLGNQSNQHLKCGKEPQNCYKSKYRTINGECNNLKHPAWGIPQMPYDRLLPPNYGDGKSSFPKTSKGKELPNAREMRLDLFPDNNVDDDKHTLLLMQYGQTIAHDMSLTAGSPQTSGKPIVCCTPNGTYTEDAKTNPLCAPIKVSDDDPIFSSEGKMCIDFVRTISTMHNKCTPRNTPAQPLSAVTAYLDLSFVYGSSKDDEKAVRAFSGGRLRSEERDHQEWLPHNPQAEDVCDGLKTPQSPCYLAGDGRVNQSPQLALLQIVFLREHNKKADKLSKMNPHWDDERTYQETKRLLTAEYQCITYNQYLPIILGQENMIKHKLIDPDAKGYINDYNSSVNTAVYVEHAASEFRSFHSTIQGYLFKYKEDRETEGSERLSDSFNNPEILEDGDNFAALARGLCSQFQQANDKYYTSEITEYFNRGAMKYGDDLIAIDIQRGRDQGLPRYVDMRAACGLSKPEKFEDMSEYMSDETIKKLKEIYECVTDIELLVGGSNEIKLPNIQMGETFLCIAIKQFQKTRYGDRYFFESGADPYIAFTLPQLNAIRESCSMSSILCDNVKGLKEIQRNAFEKVSDKNALVACNDLPKTNLSAWKEEKPEKEKHSLIDLEVVIQGI